jgi:hypothetical protein
MASSLIVAVSHGPAQTLFMGCMHGQSVAHALFRRSCQATNEDVDRFSLLLAPDLTPRPAGVDPSRLGLTSRSD